MEAAVYLGDKKYPFSSFVSDHIEVYALTAEVDHKEYSDKEKIEKLLDGMKLCRYENKLQVVLEKVHDQQLHPPTLEQQTATPLWTYATVCDRLQGPATMLETRNAEEGKGTRNARQANQHNNPSAQQHGMTRRTAHRVPRE